MDSRNGTFQSLKPLCVALSEAALALNGSSRDSKPAIRQLEALRATLISITSKSGTLDPKLADYVFFPLSQLLRCSQRLQIHALELCLESIALLVEHGWQQNIQPPLAAQVAILCTLLAEPKPSGFAFVDSSPELQAAAFLCLTQVFAVASAQRDARSVFTKESGFPQLAQTISVVLDGILNGNSVNVQTNAVRGLVIIIRDILTLELCVNFLPGVVSKLVKVLTPSTQQRRPPAVLVDSLDAISTLLRRSIGPEYMQNVQSSETTKASDDSWLQNAREQLKPALKSILRLREHSRADVKTALAQLCLILLRDCRESLPDCFSLALGAIVEIAASDNFEDNLLALSSLLEQDPSTAKLASMTFYDWLQSLPTLMQSADDHDKALKLQQMGILYKLLASTGTEMGTLNRSLSAALHDCVVLTLQLGRSSGTTTAVSGVQSLDLIIPDSTNTSTHFENMLVKATSQKAVYDAVAQLTTLISKSPTSKFFSADLSRALVTTHGEAQLANMWLLLEHWRAIRNNESDLDDFLDFGDESSSASYLDLEDVYSFALDTLSAVDEPAEPRLVSLCLQTLALRAQDVGEEFRIELVDALYPVLHTLATPDESLQQCSIATLNIFRDACGYRSVRDLIVENADYLINAVALKLNAFEVSPQAPLVLLMMVRLAGASLLPFLEDTLESIFAALEDYQGYPLLVELLFRVLRVMAEEGVKAPQLSIEGTASAEIAALLHEEWKPTSMSQLIDLVREQIVEDDELSEDLEEHPKVPWNGLNELDINDDHADGDSNAASLPENDEAEEPPPAPKVFGMLLKMTEIIQHYLPSASASLRTSLLSLVKTTVPALAKHENSLLPLVNTLWPEVTSRLEDEESHIQASALDTIAVLTEYAGDFMRSRLVQLWPGLVELYQRLDVSSKSKSGYNRLLFGQAGHVSTRPLARQQKADLMGNSTATTNYIPTSSRMVTDALTKALLVITQRVRLPPDLLEEALEMLAPSLKSESIRTALEGQHADSLWLLQARMGLISLPRVPKAPDDAGWQFTPLAISA